MKTWLRDAYRGFLWPYLAFALGALFGGSALTHSSWHDAEWPLFAAALICVEAAQQKIARPR